MITAEPDLTVTQLLPGDRFIIMGCDGIWDCLTSQGAVSTTLATVDISYVFPSAILCLSEWIEV